mmetsp:Transcript_58869/g.155054  ORF Transcript_58869/g.155054 Transcript_58869/m.155054 type:complete len:236 (+) Transcript_58869:122-829(+)
MGQSIAGVGGLCSDEAACAHLSDPSGFAAWIPADVALEQYDAADGQSPAPRHGPEGLPRDLKPPGIVLKVYLLRRHGDRLGLDLEYVPEREAMPVRTITGEVIQRWNAEHPHDALAAGDRVIEVDGARGKAEDMMKALRADTALVVLTVVRLLDYETAEDWEFLQPLDDRSTADGGDEEVYDEPFGDFQEDDRSLYMWAEGVTLTSGSDDVTHKGSAKMPMEYESGPTGGGGVSL